MPRGLRRDRDDESARYHLACPGEERTSLCKTEREYAGGTQRTEFGADQAAFAGRSVAGAGGAGVLNRVRDAVGSVRSRRAGGGEQWR